MNGLEDSEGGWVNPGFANQLVDDTCVPTVLANVLLVVRVVEGVQERDKKGDLTRTLHFHPLHPQAI